MDNGSGSSTNAVRVLLAEPRPMESQLLAWALRNQGFCVYTCESDPGAVLQILEVGAIDVLIVSSTPAGAPDISTLRTIHFSSPEIPKIVLLENDRREAVVQAFRLGARGIFYLADSSFPSFCECIQQVRR
jgi:DNA-binding NarL/FixJ family response regulator